MIRERWLWLIGAWGIFMVLYLAYSQWKGARP